MNILYFISGIFFTFRIYNCFFFLPFFEIFISFGNCVIFEPFRLVLENVLHIFDLKLKMKLKLMRMMHYMGTSICCLLLFALCGRILPQSMDVWNRNNRISNIFDSVIGRFIIRCNVYIIIIVLTLDLFNIVRHIIIN